MKQLFEGEIPHAFLKTRARGVMAGIADGMPWEIINEIIDVEGRSVVSIGKLDSRILTIVGIYAPQRRNAAYWKEVFEVVHQQGIKNLLIMGDFNAMFNNDMDRSHKSTALELP